MAWMSESRPKLEKSHGYKMRQETFRRQEAMREDRQAFKAEQAALQRRHEAGMARQRLTGGLYGQMAMKPEFASAFASGRINTGYGQYRPFDYATSDLFKRAGKSLQGYDVLQQNRDLTKALIATPGNIAGMGAVDFYEVPGYGSEVSDILGRIGEYQRTTGAQAAIFGQQKLQQKAQENMLKNLTQLLTKEDMPTDATKKMREQLTAMLGSMFGLQITGGEVAKKGSAGAIWKSSTPGETVTELMKKRWGTP